VTDFAAPILREQPRQVLRTVAFIGIIGLGIGLVVSPERAWSAFLIAAFYYLTIALGSMLLLALNYVSKAAWIVPIKRIPEAIGGYLPMGALTMLLILPGVHTLYPWSHHPAVTSDATLKAHEEMIKAKGPYLNVPFFAARMVLVLLLWIAFAYMLRANSQKQDEEPGVGPTKRNVVWSTLFLVFGAISFSVAAFDWLMSLQPHWSSTIFAWYNIAGMLVSAVSTIAVAVIFLRRRGYLPFVTDGHLHDLGKLAFGFSTLWAYMWLSQFLLIWYANLPEETTYYLVRLEGGWGFLFWANLVIGWALPFFLLIRRVAKRSETGLLVACVVLLIGRWLDIYLMVTPANVASHPGIGLVELSAYFGLGAVFVLVVERNLRRAPLAAKNDPYFTEGLHTG
jgi:hypothetical protein